MSYQKLESTTSRRWTPHRPELVGMMAAEIGALAANLLLQRADLMLAAGVLTKAMNEGHLVWWFGNGGSAAQADHFAAELAGRFQMERKPLGSVALGGSVATTTAIANDYGYEQVFSRPIEGCGRVGDVAVGLSTSGRSASVLAALVAANKVGMTTVLMTGPVEFGGADYPADVVLACPGVGKARAIQEQHLQMGHLLCEAVEQLLFGKRD